MNLNRKTNKALNSTLIVFTITLLACILLIRTEVKATGRMVECAPYTL